MDTHSKHLPADERRAVTVQAVVEFAASANPSKITRAAIANHMNLKQGTLLAHVPTKEATWETVIGWVAEGKATRELPSTLDNDAAVTPFMGSIQGPVMQSLPAGDVERIRCDAPRAFAICRHGVGSAQ